MVIKEWDNNLIVTDNVLTNLPISQLSSIDINTNGLSPYDLMLISKSCDSNEISETGYKSFNVTLDDLSAWMYSVLDINGIGLNIEEISSDLNCLLPYESMLQNISNAYISAFVELNKNGKFDPLVISALYVEKGQLLSAMGGYRFADAMANIFNWKKFNAISANTGSFDNMYASNIRVDNVSPNNIDSTNGIFKNLSATTRLSAAALTATTGNIPTLTSNNTNINNLTVKNNLNAEKDISAKNINITNTMTAPSGVVTNFTATNLTTNNKIYTSDLSVTSNTNLKNLSVDNKPYNFLSVIEQENYRPALKLPNYFYFTY